MKEGYIKINDTGQWQLIISISETGVCAVLKNLEETDSSLIPLFSKEWDTTDNLLENIEEAVYDNPRILDDFATNIIIRTKKSLWVPADTNPEEDIDEKLFTSVYPTDVEDIFSDTSERVSCLYTLVPGLNSFLRRTLAGCRVSSHLSVEKKILESIENKDTEDSPKKNAVYVVVRGEEFDIFAFCNKEFLSASTHSWREESDIVYKILLLAEAYNFDFKDITLNIIADDDAEENIKLIIKEFIEDCRSISRPSICQNDEIPLEIALAGGEKL